MVILLAVYAVCVVRSAWLCDDAYITFRTVENVVDGYGPRWNVADRVQTYTHPLWMWLLAGLRALTGEIYYTALALGLVVSLGSVGWLTGALATNARGAVVALAILVSSRAFVDYSTSGLENPLAHALLLAFVGLAVTGQPTAGRLRSLALLAGLIGCTRMDLLVLLVPTLALWAWRLRFLPAVRALAVGFAPLFAWTAFATFYYGFPYPNTAAAKLFGLGVPAHELWQQGALYLETTALHDPVTALGLAAGVVAGVFGSTATRLLALGIVLQVVYVARVGGDFMLGRFLTPPLVVAAACIARTAWVRTGARPLGALAAIGLALLLCPRVTLAADGGYRGQGQIARGIWDERGSYYAHLGLLSPTRAPFQPSTSTIFNDVFTPERPEVRLMTSVGGPGFAGGRRLHILDPHVCDPLLARLPAIDASSWRPGHTMRRVPEGYFESVAHDENRIVHPGLAVYYDALRAATRAPLLSAGRLRTVFGLLTGAFEPARQSFLAEAYWTPPMRVLDADAANRKVADGTRWMEADGIVIGEGGVGVRFAHPTTARTLLAALHSGGIYRFAFSLGGEERGAVEVSTPHALLPCMGNHAVAVPEPARAGFDLVHVRYVARASREPLGVLAALVPDPPGH